MNWLGLHWLDWTVLAVYLIGITALGTWSYRRVKNMEDFFMGGRRFGKVFMTFFAFGAGTSSEQAVSVSSGAFRNGLAGIWYQFMWLWSTPFYWIIAPVFRRMRALTTSDFFEARYDTSTATLYSVLGIAMSIVFIGAALFGSGQMIEGLSGGQLKAQYTILAMTVMFVIYGMAGGLGAAIITDFVQGILTIIFSFLLLPFALHTAAQVLGTANGFEALHANLPSWNRPDMLSLTLTAERARAMGQEPINPFYVVVMSLNALLGIVVQPHIMGVCSAGKTEFEGRFGFTFGNFMKRFCTIAWSFIGLACIAIYLTPNNEYLSAERIAEIQGSSAASKTFADQVFGLAAHDILPTISYGLVGLLLASLLAAIMSTCDALMVVSSGLFTENIYRRFLRTDASARHYLWVGRFAGLAIVGCSLLMQTQFKNVIDVLTTYVQAFPAFMGICFWLGITWRRYTPKAVWASTIVTALLWFLTQTHQPITALSLNIDYYPSQVRHWLHEHFPYMMIAQPNGNFKTSVPYQMLIYMTGGALAGVVVSLVTRPTAKDKLDYFFRLIRTPIRRGEHIETPCTLPENPLPPNEGKLINLPSIEIPRPTAVGLCGFAAAWVMVGLILWLTWGLAGLGGAH